MARPSPLYARQRAAHGLCAGGAVLYRLRCFEPRLAVRLRAYGLHRLFSGRGCILSVGLCGRPAAAAAAGRLQRRFCGRSGSRIPHPLPLASKRRTLPAGARRLDGCLGTARRVRASMGRPSPLCPPQRRTSCAVYPFPLLRRAVPRPQAPAGAVLGTVRLYGGPGNLPLAERRRSAAPAAELRPLRTAAGCSAVCRRTGFFQHKRPLLCRRGRRRLVHGGARLRCFAGNDPCSLYRGRPHFGR